MSHELQVATVEVLDYLSALGQEGVRPVEAQRRLRAVQARHPEIVMELVWEEESYDGSVHYDALLRESDGATLSVSLNRDDGLPWPLRGVRRWSDADLAQVNGEILKIQDAVGLLDFLGQDTPVLQRLVDVCLIRQELAQRPIPLSDAELQRGLDDLRRAHKLHGAADTARWMRARGLTHERLEQLVVDHLTIDRLGERIAEGRVERHFEAQRAQLDTARLARLEFGDEESARRTYRRLCAGELDFFAAAEQAFLAAPKSERALFVSLQRSALSEELGAAVFAATPGSVLEPMRLDDRFVILRVLSLAPAQLDGATRVAIQQQLLEAWLAARREQADVTWFWGTSERATKAA